MEKVSWTVKFKRGCKPGGTFNLEVKADNPDEAEKNALILYPDAEIISVEYGYDKYPKNLCPLCGKVMWVSNSETISSNQVEVTITCSNVSNKCPYEKTYILTVENIAKHGYPKEN